MSAAGPAGRGRPRLLLLADRPGWAYDFVARSLAARLRRDFAVTIAYARLRPRLDPARFDLLHVFYWAEPWHRRFGFERRRVVKEVASHRWATEEVFGRLSEPEFVARHLEDCATVTTPARFLHEILSPYHSDVFLCPNGVEPTLFRPPARRSGPLRIGWVGTPSDPSKGLDDVLRPACGERFELLASPGTWRRARVARLYREVDVLAIASLSESQPLPLLEGMAAGCFPVATAVGLVPELVRDGWNGRIVARRPEAFRGAFERCEQELDRVRRAGEWNARLVRAARGWEELAARYREVFAFALARAEERPHQRPPPTPPLPAPVRLLFCARTPGELEEGLALSSTRATGPTGATGATGAKRAADAVLDGVRWRLADSFASLAGRLGALRMRLSAAADRLPGGVRLKRFLRRWR